MSRFKVVAFLWFALFMAACSRRPSTPPTPAPGLDEQAALDTLMAFFDHLHEGRYEDASALYGGTYEIMRDWNPDVSSDDFSGLMRNACEINGIKCLNPLAVIPFGKISRNAYSFTVEFTNEDGSLFVRGPCCGASAADDPPRSEFEFIVVKDSEGKFLVQDMPPYVP